MLSPKAELVLVGLVTAILIIGLSAFAAGDWLTTLELSVERARFWELIGKAIGGIFAFGAVVAALWRYFDDRAKAARAALIEAQKPFMTKRQDIYFQLVSETAWIGTKDANDPRREEAISLFWWIYWGPLPMVADDQVAAAADKFSEILHWDYVMPAGVTDKHLLLRNASMDLARSCRTSLGFIPYQ